MSTAPLSALRTLGFIEGVSMLLLVGVAMPLKYVWGWPHAVMWVGWAHGALFMAFNGAALLAAFRYGWPLSKFLWLGVASVFPFGTFIADAKLLKPEFDRERDARQPSLGRLGTGSSN